jgi:copper chaperone CopZ
MLTAVSALMACALQCFLADTILPSTAAALTSVKNERLLIAIEGMQCTSCANGIKVMLKRSPGVISAEVSYERSEADVQYDSSGTTPEKIIKAITNMGYKATVKQHRET